MLYVLLLTCTFMLLLDFHSPLLFLFCGHESLDLFAGYFPSFQFNLIILISERDGLVEVNVAFCHILFTSSCKQELQNERPAVQIMVFLSSQRIMLHVHFLLKEGLCAIPIACLLAEDLWTMYSKGNMFVAIWKCISPIR